MSSLIRWGLCGLLWLGPSCLSADDARVDLLIADFEGENYGDWKTSGEAFGTGPARGTLPGQMQVEGFLGKGLVNSFLQGDRTTGTLTSAPFKLERKFVNFLIGGGKHPGTTLTLLVDDQTVRSATGPNDRPGGTERLEWQSWDVAELMGRSAVLRIVDTETGGWGHINVDHIVQSDRRREIRPRRREVQLTQSHLQLPVKHGAARRRMKYFIGERCVREFDIELADEQPDAWFPSDVSLYRGERLIVEAPLPDDSQALESIAASAPVADDPTRFSQANNEKHRPQFHFTARHGWLNDPNGLVWHEGEYHLYFQHNPYGREWGNMHWGHAVSKDLLHWQELPIALYPQKYDDWCFSGSAVVDAQNTAGFQQGDAKVLVAAYTSTGRGECIVYSQDRGRTWVEYEKNPVVKHAGRDPKLLWHEPSRKWVMAVYDESAGKERAIVFYNSANLKDWELTSRIEGFFECPDLFELPVDGDAKNRKWILYGADGQYIVGQFDGRTFTKESGKHQVWHGNFYAAQTVSDTPDRRRIQIGWGQGITFPAAAFNQQMTIPSELTLRATANGVRMFVQPVAELDSLHRTSHEWSRLNVTQKDVSAAKISSDLLDIQAEINGTTAKKFGLVIRGEPVTYDVEKSELSCKGRSAPLSLAGGRLKLRILVDRGSFEIFGNDGQIAMSIGAITSPTAPTAVLFSEGGATTFSSLRIFELNSAREQ